MTEELFVKICGVTSEADALLAVSLAVSAIGFIFAPSPRQVAGATGGRHRQATPRAHPDRWCLPGRSPSASGGGGEGGRPGRCGSCTATKRPRRPRGCGARVPTVIKAFQAGERAIERFAEFGADYLLVDGANPGSGRVFDWRLAEGVADHHRLIVSGGLRPENVAQAVAHLRPAGVDVSTGVESDPGRKDPLRLREFIANVLARRRRGGVPRPTGAPRRGRTLRLEGRVSSDSLMERPGPDGRFGTFGGRFVPESLMPACLELETSFDAAWAIRPFGVASTVCSARTAVGPRP